MRALGWILALLVAAGCTTAGRQPNPTPGPRSATLAPAPADPSPTPAEVRFAAVGDVGEPTDVQAQVVDRIVAVHAERPIDVLLLLGDLVYPDGAMHRFQRKFADPFRPVTDAGIALAAALGNHDVQTRNGADMIQAFNMPGRYYSFRIGPVAFFALDSTRIDREQLDWLGAELEANDRPWTVLFMHHPPYSAGRHGSSMDVRRALEPLIRRFGARLVLAGHDHDYQRSVEIEGTTYVVAGTGCCLRRTGQAAFTASSASVPAVVVVDATPERLALQAVQGDGRVIDQFQIEAAEEEAA